MLLCVLDSVSESVRAFDSGDDTLVLRKKEECLHSLLVACGNVVNSACIAKICVLRANAGVVKTACDRVNGKGLAAFVLKKIAVKAVESALRAVLHGSRVVSDLASSAERLNTVNFNGVLKEGGEKTERV